GASGSLGREAAAERAGVGKGRAWRRARARDRRGLAVDLLTVHRLSRVPRLPISGVLGGLLRRRIAMAARRLLGDRSLGGAIELPQLGLPAAAPDLLGHQVCA